jgi:hypothetical protein
VAFFSLVDIDKVLRKEPSIDCVTPTNPVAIPPGRSINIYQLLESCPGLGPADAGLLDRVKAVKTEKLFSGFRPHPTDEAKWLEALRRQMEQAPGTPDDSTLAPGPGPSPRSPKSRAPSDTGTRPAESLSGAKAGASMDLPRHCSQGMHSLIEAEA